MAARVRAEASQIFCRYLGGDLALVDEICALRGLQEHLRSHAPEDPRRLFGEAVEASRSTSPQVAQVLSSIHQKLAVHDQTLNEIREHLKNDRQRVNLNVRTPRRSGPYQARISTDISAAGRPFPIARFLDQKEHEDPSWKAIRKSFAPSFGILM